MICCSRKSCHFNKKVSVSYAYENAKYRYMYHAINKTVPKKRKRKSSPAEQRTKTAGQRLLVADIIQIHSQYMANKVRMVQLFDYCFHVFINC